MSTLANQSNAVKIQQRSITSLIALIVLQWLVPEVPFGLSSISLAILAIPFLWIQAIRQMPLHRVFAFSWASLWVGALGIYIVVTSLVGYASGYDVNFLRMLQWLAYFSLYFPIRALLANDIDHRFQRALEVLVPLYAISIIVSAVLGRPLTFWLSEKYLAQQAAGMPFYRGVGTVGSSHIAGGALAAAIGLIYFGRKSKCRNGKSWLAVIILSFVGLVFTGSRSATLAFLSSALLVMFIVFLRNSLFKKRYNRSKKLMLIFGIVVIVFLFFLSKFEMRTRLHIPLGRRISMTKIQTDFMLRLSKHSEGIQEWLDNPLFAQVFGMGFFAGERWEKGSYHYIISVHNSYITFLRNTGLIGLTILLSGLIFGLLMLLFRFLSLGVRKDLGAAWVLMVIMMHCMTENFLYNGIYLTLIGIAMAHLSIDKTRYIRLYNRRGIERT